MLDSIIKVNNYCFQKQVENDIFIVSLGDLHLCESFDIKKLDILYNYLLLKKPNYIYMVGDIIDSTNFLYANVELKNKYIFWLESLSKICPIFICLGSHDFSKLIRNGWIKDSNFDFWKNVNSIKNIHVSHFEPFYEDKNIINCMIELDYDYYHKYKNKEDKTNLINYLNKIKSELLGLDNEKLKTIINHSPIYMSDKEVIQYFQEFDLFFSGHMHAGMLPFSIGKFLPSNRGLISPKKTLFPDNARGIKKISNNDKDQFLIVTGGITKLQECSKISRFNKIFPMDVDEIIIKKLK